MPQRTVERGGRRHGELQPLSASRALDPSTTVAIQCSGDLAPREPHAARKLGKSRETALTSLVFKANLHHCPNRRLSFLLPRRADNQWRYSYQLASLLRRSQKTGSGSGIPLGAAGPYASRFFEGYSIPASHLTAYTGAW